MMTNLHRPCTITYPLVVNEGKPFDAMVLEIGFHVNDQDLYLTHSNSVDEPITFHHVFHFDTLSQLERVKHSVEWQIAEALNAPVKVTPEWVESVGEKRRSFLFSDGEYVDDLTHWFKHSFNCFTRTDVVLGEQYFVKATCPETLEYLLQFTLDGKRKETK